MLTGTEPTTATPLLPRALRYCKACRKETTHEIRAGAGVIARICVACLEKALRHEPEHD